MKNQSVKPSTKKTDILSKKEDFQFIAKKQALMEIITKLFNSYKFVFGFQLDLIKNISFSSKVNFKLFKDLYKKYEASLKSVFGDLNAEQLFKIFDEDEDKYLNEDEQLLIFIILNSKLHYLYEECIFFGYYEGIKKIEMMQEDISKVITELQTTLRNNLYKEQLKIFNHNKEHILDKHKSKFQKRMVHFDTFKNQKLEEIQQAQMEKRFSTLLKTNAKIANFNFTKYGQIQDIKIQEKFLSIFGNIEEATNLKKIYKKTFALEKAKLNDRIASYTNKINKNLESKFNFKNEMLQYKLDIQEANLKESYLKNRNLVMKKLKTQENKIVKLQDHLNSAVNKNFYRQNYINKLKSQSRLKKDIVRNVRVGRNSFSKREAYHSSAYRRFYDVEEQTKDVKNNDENRLMNYKNSDFNYRFNLRSFNKQVEPINMAKVQKSFKENSLKKINRLINSNQIDNQKHTNVELARFYICVFLIVYLV